MLVLAFALQLAAPDVVVVTADREARSLADVPTSISRIEVLPPSGAARPAETINQAPGANIQAGSGREHLSAIRSPVLTGGAGAGSFLYLQDGVPLRSAGFANVNGLFEAGTPFARAMEVVRGPGEITYGSNAVHGAVNAISADPMAAPGGWAALSAGAFDRFGATVEAARGGLFLGLHGFTDGGYREESGVDQLKAQLAHGAVAGDVKVTTRLHLHQLEQETAGFVVGDDAYVDDDLRRGNPNPDAFRDTQHALLSSQIEMPVGDSRLSITPYALWTDMTFRLHFLPSQAVEESAHHAVGILSQLRGEVGQSTEWLLGLDAEWADGALREEQFIPTVFSYTQGLHYDYEVTALSAAPFVRVRHELTDRLTVQAGGRLTMTSYDYTNKTDAGVVGRFLRPDDREDSFTAVTAKVASTYRLDDRVTVWASLSRGARPPQTTDLYRLQINQDVGAGDVETLDMAEVGVRYAGQALSLDVVGFSGRKENFLFRDADGFTVEDGVTDHEGVEVSATLRPAPWVSVAAAGTVARHTYEFDRDVGRATEVITAGTEVDTAPNTIGSLEVTVTPTARWALNLGLRHVGSYLMDAAGTETYPGHDIVRLGVRYRLPDELSVNGEIYNLFDERYARRADFAFGNERYFPGEERHFNLVVEKRF